MRHRSLNYCRVIEGNCCERDILYSSKNFCKVWLKCRFESTFEELNMPRKSKNKEAATALPYQCQLCSFATGFAASFQKHKETVHQANARPDPSQQYYCEACGVQSIDKRSHRSAMPGNFAYSPGKTISYQSEMDPAGLMQRCFYLTVCCCYVMIMSSFLYGELTEGTLWKTLSSNKNLPLRSTRRNSECHP